MPELALFFSQNLRASGIDAKKNFESAWREDHPALIRSGIHIAEEPSTTDTVSYRADIHVLRDGSPQGLVCIPRYRSIGGSQKP